MVSAKPKAIASTSRTQLFTLLSSTICESDKADVFCSFPDIVAAQSWRIGGGDNGANDLATQHLLCCISEAAKETCKAVYVYSERETRRLFESFQN